MNHAERARDLVADELHGGSFDQTRDYIALAQVHATLALVEQQRIANLIAIGQFRIGDQLPPLRIADIREGLGL